jgi:threonylcarbamoyladenosine tRNA methylthiotransferase MtaB
MKFYIETLGCKVNSYESESIKELLINNGYIESNINDANVVIINTCTVTNQADSKSRKSIRHARKINGSAILVVVGCMVEYHKNDLSLIDADIIIGNKDKTKLLSLIDDYIRHNEHIIKLYDLRNTNFEDMVINNFEGHTRGFVKIQDGCNNFCSYCVIPYTRGNIRSKDIDTCYEEIKCLVDNGYQEIVLTGIHTGSYGSDLGYTLTDLLKRISEIDGLKRIRISSIEITELGDSFMEELKNNNKIVSHFHVPIQSGSDHILKLMNRKYTIEEYKDKIKELRSIRCDANITTDLIVGFPEETDEDQETTLNNLLDIGFSKVHTFPYSKREGTKAATMKQVNDTVKHNRVNEVLALSDKLEHDYYEKYKGKVVEVLSESGNDGFTSNYIKIHFDKYVEPNKFVNVLITDVDGKTVNGQVM